MDTLSFGVDAGLRSTRSFNVPIVNDILVENDENINIQATIQGNVGLFSEGGVTSNVEVIIMNDDGESQVGRLDPEALNPPFQS